ncbi:uncharacterized protein [Nicotiana sylvestris]|uniref:uncharacterized protein n=1 Tax=Nicotiana sylvestris TaxID=4096 RepID=UPI00388CAFED
MKIYLVGEDLWEFINGSNISPPAYAPENSNARKKWKNINARAEFILKKSISPNLFDHIIRCKLAHEIWRTFDWLFNKKDEAHLQILENKLANTTQGNLSIAEYFLKVKNLCSKISLLNPDEAISGARITRIIIRGLKAEYISFVISIQGWVQQSSLEEFEDLLSSHELLAKQMASVSIKEGEGIALVADKRNFNGKSRDIVHFRSSSGSSSPGKKGESSSNGKKPLKCYRYGKDVGTISLEINPNSPPFREYNRHDVIVTTDNTVHNVEKEDTVIINEKQKGTITLNSVFHVPVESELDSMRLRTDNGGEFTSDELTYAGMALKENSYMMIRRNNMEWLKERFDT